MMKNRKLLILILFNLFIFQSLLAQQSEVKTSADVKKRQIIVKTVNGDLLKGILISQNEDSLVMKTTYNPSLAIPNDQIASIEFLEEGQPKKVKGEKELKESEAEEIEKEPYLNESRYFLTQSAFNLNRSEITIRNNPMSFEYGITDDLSFSVGTSFFTVLSGNFIFQASSKYTYELNDFIRFKLSGNLIFSNNIDYNETFYSLGTGVTIGIPDAHITLSAYNGNGGDLVTSDYFYSAATNLRIFKSISLITENIFFQEPSGNMRSYSTYAIRLLEKNVTIDLGVFNSSELTEVELYAIPVIAFNWRIN